MVTAVNDQLWIPGALRKPLAQGNDPDIVPVGAIFHVAVSEAPSLLGAYQHRADGVESTGYIRRDGTIEQYRPVNVECDAQWDGNSFGWPRRRGFTSWETQGMGDGEWTPEQLAAIKRIVLFHYAQWGVPLRQAPAWNRAGFGYHSLFDRWNKSHHTCPGPARIAQWHSHIAPHLASWAAPPAATASPSPGHLTLVERARADLTNALDLLDRAVAGGRVGPVQDSRDALKQALAQHPLPRK